MHLRILTCIFAVLLLSIQGCVSLQSFPTVARAGETITLAVGSQDGLTSNNVQILYYPDGQTTPIDLTSNIRSVFKIAPDKTSYAWQFQAVVLNNASGHTPWLNVIAIDLPDTLPTGKGYFKIVFGNSVVEPNPAIVASAESKEVAIEIIPGIGSASTFPYQAYPSSGASLGDLSSLQPLPHIVLRYVGDPNFTGQTVAAAEYRIKLPISGDLTKIDNRYVRVIWDDKPADGAKQIQLSWSRNVDELKVNVLSLPVSGDSFYAKQIRFSILVLPHENGIQIDPAGTPQLLSYRYFDDTGTEVTPLAVPEIKLMQ